MITKATTPRFVTTDGTEHKTIEEAQVHELAQMLMGVEGMEPGTAGKIQVTDLVSKFLVDNAEKVVDVLSMTPRSLPLARSINGGRKPRKPRATAPATAQALPDASAKL